MDPLADDAPGASIADLFDWGPEVAAQAAAHDPYSSDWMSLPEAQSLVQPSQVLPLSMSTTVPPSGFLSHSPHLSGPLLGAHPQSPTLDWSLPTPGPSHPGPASLSYRPSPQLHQSPHQSLYYPSLPHSATSSIPSSGYSSPHAYYPGTSLAAVEASGGSAFGQQEQSLLALQLSLQAQALAQYQQQQLEFAELPRAYNGENWSGPHPAGLSARGQPHVSHQRMVPPLSAQRRISQHAPPTSSSSALGAPSSSSQSSRPIRRPSATPGPSHVPASPRAPVDYSFQSLESELDRFTSGSADFTTVATAAIASSGAALGSTKPEGSSPTTFSTLPVRSPSASAVASPSEGAPVYPVGPTPATSNASSSNKPSPTTDSHSHPHSPASSTSAAAMSAAGLFDAFDGEGGSASDPIAAQAWRMITKAKNTMPNGARMENLTWRLMSMTLKKRREETAAAEARLAAETHSEAQRVEAQLQLLKVEEAEEEQESIAPLQQDLVTKHEVSEDRGRRGRTSASKSPSQSPEVEEEFMDWRAKSQSRSRSRLPDKAMMDWRAQSRSRSRAPDFRLAGVALPPVASYDMATAQLNLNAPSRFYGDHGIIPASLDNDNIHYDLAQSLGLSGDAFGSYGVDGVDLPELVSPVEQVEGSLHNVSLPVPGAQAAADLDWSSVPSSYDLGIHSYPITKEPISKSPVVASQAQQQLQQLMQPPRKPSELQRLPTPAAGVPSGHAVPPSALSLARPTTMTPIPFASPFSTSPVPTAHLLSTTAPSYFGGMGGNPTALLHYFSSTTAVSASLYSPSYLSSSAGAGPSSLSPATTSGSIDPAHLFSSSPSSQPLYNAESGWGFTGLNSSGLAPRSISSSLTAAVGPLPATEQQRQQVQQRPATSTNIRSLSSPNLAGLDAPRPSSTASAPVSRLHSRQSTLAPLKLLEHKSSVSKASSSSQSTTPATTPGAVPPVESNVVCLNCGTSNTPLWRRNAEGHPLCNACGLFKNLHGIDRPAALNTGVIKKRNRARGPKNEAAPKKTGGTPRAAARKNSAGGPLPAAPLRAQARTSGMPYPSASDRATHSHLVATTDGSGTAL